MCSTLGGSLGDISELLCETVDRPLCGTEGGDSESDEEVGLLVLEAVVGRD